MEPGFHELLPLMDGSALKCCHILLVIALQQDTESFSLPFTDSYVLRYNGGITIFGGLHFSYFLFLNYQN